MSEAEVRASAEIINQSERRIIRNVEFLVGIGAWVILERLDQIEHKIDRILRLEHKEMADLSRITDEVSQNSDAIASAVTLLGELAALVRAAGTDQGALDDLANTLDAQSAALAAAVVENTPAAPEPTPEG